MRYAKLGLALTAALTMLLLVVPSAGAQYPPPPPEPSAVGIQCVPSDVEPTATTDEAVQPGTEVICVLGGFAPASQIAFEAVAADGTVVFSTILTADAAGQATVSFVVPAGVSGDELTFQASGQGADGEVLTIADALELEAAEPDGAGLPITGAQSLVLAALAAFAVLGGAILLFVSRRRNPSA